MREQGWVTFDRPPSSRTRGLLRSTGAGVDGRGSLTWTFSTPKLAQEVADRASAAGDAAVHGVRFRPGRGDEPAGLAAYLPLAALADVDVAGSGEAGTPLLAYDEERALTLGNKGSAAVLGLAGPTWTADPATGLLVLRVDWLPEPVVVARVLELFEGAHASFVRSDGDERLGAGNAWFLRKHGVAATRECLVDGRPSTWVRPLVVRGDLVRRLLDAGTRGLLPPRYLGPSSDRLPSSG